MLARSMVVQEFENWPVKQGVETCSMVTQASHQYNNVQVVGDVFFYFIHAVIVNLIFL
jgi:hypothetical protein